MMHYTILPYIGNNSIKRSYTIAMVCKQMKTTMSEKLERHTQETQQIRMHGMRLHIKMFGSHTHIQTDKCRPM